MSVKQEANGRRSVQVEFEVPGTPEEVWQAIATGPGISSWFVPAEFEERDGKPVALKFKFGPGMEPSATVTAWDPPRMYAGEGEVYGGSPPIATEWSIEARAGGVCLVRIVHSLFASTDEWDNQLEGAKSGWSGFLAILRIYLKHFRGQRSAIMQVTAPATGTDAEAWEALTSALGVKGVERRAALDDARGCLTARRRGGVTHRGSVRRPAEARQAGARHRRPWRRHLSRRTGRGGDELVPVRRSGGRNRRPRNAAWQAWMQERFPMPTELSQSA